MESPKPIQDSKILHRLYDQITSVSFLPQNTGANIYNPFTNSTAFFMSSSSGCPFAIPPTSLNGPNVS